MGIRFTVYMCVIRQADTSIHNCTTSQDHKENDMKRYQFAMTILGALMGFALMAGIAGVVEGATHDVDPFATAEYAHDEADILCRTFATLTGSAILRVQLGQDKATMMKQMHAKVDERVTADNAERIAVLREVVNAAVDTAWYIRHQASALDADAIERVTEAGYDGCYKAATGQE